MPGTTLDLKGGRIQGKSNTDQRRSPHTGSQGHLVFCRAQSPPPLHCPGLSIHNSTVKEYQICSRCISSVLTIRIIVCLYFKAKGKQLKRGFAQLSATSILALRYAKVDGHSTAKERKQCCGTTTSKRWSWAQNSA